MKLQPADDERKLKKLAQVTRRRVDGTPKHVQLREALIAGIARGDWRPGDRFPTEIQLTRTTPYSLGTVQRALRSLVEDGLIERRQGSGTVVAESRRAMEDPLHLRFLGMDGKSILPIFPKVVERRRVAARGPWSAPLGQTGDDIVRVDRVIRIADEFSVFSEFYANAARFGVLMELPLAELDSANFKIVLNREYKLPITRFEERARVGRFPKAIAGAIGVAPDAHGMIVHITARTGRDITVYYQILYIPPSERWLQILMGQPPAMP